MALLGMRGSGDWQTDERPKSWRESILYLYPNGTVPLTAILSKMGSEAVEDPQFHWWTKKLQTQGGDVTNIYTDSGLSSAYTSGGVSGDVLYAQVSADTVKHFREGHQVMLRDKSDYTVDVVGKVVGIANNGSSSYIAVKLLEDDDNSASNNLSNSDYILVVGNINEEGASMPDAIAYDPVKWYNFTQIMRTPLSITRTAQRTRLRTGDAYKEAKREALEYHSIELEKAFLFGVPTENTGDGGKPERTTMGLINAIRGGYDGHGGTAGVTDNFTATYSGSKWIDKGEEWLDNQLEEIFRYGDEEKMALVGNGALLGINNLVKTYGSFDLKVRQESYGIRIIEWTTPFGTIMLKRHPLLSFDATNRNSMIIFEPRNIKYRYIDDTTFFDEKEKQNTGAGRRDAKDEEYLTECGLEYHHPVGWGYLNGVGVDG